MTTLAKQVLLNVVSFLTIRKQIESGLQYIEDEKPEHLGCQNKGPQRYFLRKLKYTKDLAGGERQRVFWKQQYEGTQGIIYMIDVTSSNEEK